MDIKKEYLELNIKKEPPDEKPTSLLEATGSSNEETIKKVRFDGIDTKSGSGSGTTLADLVRDDLTETLQQNKKLHQLITQLHQRDHENSLKVCSCNFLTFLIFSLSLSLSLSHFIFYFWKILNQLIT